MPEAIRHNARTVVNVLTLAAAVLVLPELGKLIPLEALPIVASIAAILNTILSFLRKA